MLVKLNKRSNSNTEWGKMAKRSSNSKEKVHSLSVNIKVIMNLTEKSIASCDYCDKNNRSSQCWNKGKNFWVGKLEHVKNSWNFGDESLITVYMTILTLFRVLLGKIGTKY